MDDVRTDPPSGKWLAFRDEMLGILAAPADNDLYRVCQGIGVPVVFRRRDGRLVDAEAVCLGIALGMFGAFAGREKLEDGTLVERLDLSEYGMEWYLANGAE